MRTKWIWWARLLVLDLFGIDLFEMSTEFQRAPWAIYRDRLHYDGVEPSSRSTSVTSAEEIPCDVC